MSKRKPSMPDDAIINEEQYEPKVKIIGASANGFETNPFAKKAMKDKTIEIVGTTPKRLIINSHSSNPILKRIETSVINELTNSLAVHNIVIQTPIPNQQIEQLELRNYPELDIKDNSSIFLMNTLPRFYTIKTPAFDNIQGIQRRLLETVYNSCQNEEEYNAVFPSIAQSFLLDPDTATIIYLKNDIENIEA